MAINKRKILQSAQKNLQRGAFDRALKDYKTLLEADPKDVNLRLKVGDVYLKQGKNDEAVLAYTKVAERFMKDGFDAKAVALYKQITKIDSKRVDVYVPLAELYQRLGLISDAMGALQTAADAHYREGDKPAALELLRKMATLDPANTTSRLKVAELLRQEGMTPEALAEFEAVAEELERQGEVEGRVSVLQKILELAPGQGKGLEGLGRSYLAQRKWSQGAEVGQQLVTDVAEFAVEGYEILVEAAEGLGREVELPHLYQSMAQALRERGDDARARELVQRYCGGGALSAEGGDLPHLESDEESAAFDAAVGGQAAFGDDELDDPGFVTDGGLRLDSPEVERDAIDGRRRASAMPEASNRDMPLPPIEGEDIDATDTPAPEGDPDQLVAEASVYLRYGKSERAVDSLRAALVQEPAHLVALEKLGEALHASGDSENAVQAWLRGAEAAAAAGDDAMVSALYGRVSEVDPSAVPSAEPEPARASADAGADAELEAENARGTLDDEDDIEIEIDEASFEGAPEDSPPAEAGAEAADESADVDDDATDVALDLDDEIVPDEKTLEVGSDTGAALSAAADAVGLEDSLPSTAATEFEIDLSDAEIPSEPVADEDLVDNDLADEDLADDGELDLSDGEFLSDDPATDEPAVDLSRPEADATQEPVFDESLSDELVTDEPVADEPVAEAAGSDELVTDEPDFDDSLSDEFVTDEPIDDLPAGAEDPSTDELSAREELDSDESSDGASLDLADDLSDAEAEVGAMPVPAAAVTDVSLETASSTTPHQIIEELEEGEFYLEQGMLEEAAEVYQRILAVAPSHPQAMVRLGEIEARQGQEPGAPAAPALATPLADDDEITGELPVVESASVLDDASAEDTPADLDAADTGEAPEAQTAEATAAEPEEDGDFDLAAELSDVFDDDDTGSGLRGGAGTEEEGFEQVFAAFKAGVDKELGEGDHEARYDLGIAYKEMGLLDDAIGEFRVAMQDPDRQLQSLHMMGVCALDLGRADDAVAHFGQALAVQDLPDDQQMALRFDLGRAEHARGDRERARAEWEAVVAVDPDFQDVGERLAELDREPLAVPGAEDRQETFESFDDLIDESESGEAVSEPEAAAEEYESFDDLMSDDEDDEGAEESEGAESAAPPSDSEYEEEEAGADVTQVAEVTAEETDEPALDVASADQTGEPVEAGSAEPASNPDPEAEESEPNSPDAPEASEPDLEPPAPTKRRRKKISFL